MSHFDEIDKKIQAIDRAKQAKDPKTAGSIAVELVDHIRKVCDSPKNVEDSVMSGASLTACFGSGPRKSRTEIRHQF